MNLQYIQIVQLYLVGDNIEATFGCDLYNNNIYIFGGSGTNKFNYETGVSYCDIDHLKYQSWKKT